MSTTEFTFKEMMDSVYGRVDDLHVIGRALTTEHAAPTELSHQFDAVRSCVAIGAGYGRLEMLFLKTCFPNLVEFTAVEPDSASVDELKKTFADQLPNVRSVFCEETVQSWRGVHQTPVDSVFLFHFLYYLNPEERCELFRRLFDRVLHRGSYVFVLTHMPYNSGGEPSAYLRAIRMMQSGGEGAELPTDGGVREAMTAVGFELNHEQVFDCHLNVENVDDTFLSLLFAQCAERNLEAARRVALQVFGGSKRVRHDSWLGVFSKP